jgi:hypothetical protein
MLGSAIDSVRIVLDEKTMTHPMRRLFTQTLRRMGTSVRELLRRHIQLEPVNMSRYESRIQFSSETTFINWSDDGEEFRSEFGLRLADRLAHKMYRQLENTKQTSIECKLREAGFEDFVIDITGVVTRFDPRLVANFRRNTGLPEPREL